MKLKALVLVILLLTNISTFAQSVDTAWVRTYDGPSNYVDEAYAQAVDDSGNVYVTGYSYLEPSLPYNRDYATIKYLANGDTAWIRRYNGPADSDDFVYALAIDCYGICYVT